MTKEKVQEENPQEEKIVEEIHQEEEFKDKYFRLLAEMENARKRLQKEKHDMTRFAIENVISELLTPIDTFEAALNFTGKMSEDTQNWAKGFEMILAQFKEILSNHNISAFHSEGEQFDPYKHEAVEMEETRDFEEGIILHEFLKGYKSGDRILRAARVKVAKTPKEEIQEEKNKEKKHDGE